MEGFLDWIDQRRRLLDFAIVNEEDYVDFLEIMSIEYSLREESTESEPPVRGLGTGIREYSLPITIT